MGSFRRSFRGLVRAPGGISAIVVLALLVAVAVVAPPVFGERAAKLAPLDARQGITAKYWLGTDDLGRDIFARTLVATRLSLRLALLAAGLGAAIGLSVGGVISVLSGRARQLATRFLHVSLAFPPLVVALFVSAILGTGSSPAVLAIGLAIAPGFARVTQTLAAQVSGAEYVSAARVLGVGRARMLRRYIVPNIAEPLIIQATVAVSASLVAVSALSFLGLGVQPPEFDWGRMLAEGLDKIFTVPVVALAPAGAIIASGLAFGFLGEALARSANPALWTADTPRSVAGAEPAIRRRRRITLDVSGVEPTVHADNDHVVLDARGLTVTFARGDHVVEPVRDLDLTVRRGEIVGIVGESGSGKSLTAMAVAQLLPYPGTVHALRLTFEGQGLLGGASRLQRLLGTRLALVYQDPMSTLNPALKVGRQLTEGVEVHRGVPHRDALATAEHRLRDVHVSAPRRRLGQYPHELSGGMRQRVMIAMGLMGEPSLLIADEPTTALDVTVQAQVIDLLRELNAEFGTAIVLISHDISVIAEICTRTVVMYAGRIVEDASTDLLLQHPAHPYTRALLASVPDLETDIAQPLATIPGLPPAPDQHPDGCAFAPRCPDATDVCGRRPSLVDLERAHLAACWHAEPPFEHGDLLSPGAVADGRR